MTTTVNIKPLSVNKAWQGRRFKTPEYKAYEQAVLMMLPNEDLPSPPYRVHIGLSLSNRNSDIDNPVKPILDILQKKYRFNDREVMSLLVVKDIVAKGKEGFVVYISSYEEARKDVPKRNGL